MFLRFDVITLGLALCSHLAFGFTVGRTSEGKSSLLLMRDSSEAETDASSRRDFFTKAAAVTVAGLGCPFLPLDVANAVSGVGKVNSKLKGYGLPQIAKVEGGFSPLLEVYGRGKNRFPILVQFNYPLSWVVTLPSNDSNGEDGTVQAGDYGKGDTATFFVLEQENVKDISNAPKSLLEKAITKSISQKGDNMYQSFKLIKTEPVERDGQQYVIVDFKYELLTGAGFIVERRGVASITSQGQAVEVLWTATISQRFKKMETTLRYIAESFRCYTDGLNLSDDLYSAFEDQ